MATKTKNATAKKIEAADARDAARMESSDVVVEQRGCGCWQVVGGGFWLCVRSGLSDGLFAVDLYRPHPNRITYETVTATPPRTVAEAVAFAEGR